jgi:phosphoglycolate phosphatase
MALTAMTDCGADPRRTVLIGDTGWDMAMARAAGCHALGVLWGYHDADELSAGGAQALAAHPGEVPDLTESLVKVTA